MVDLPLSQAWAVSQPLNFEGGGLSALAPGQFMSDGHTLKLLDETPAYVGRVSVQLMRKDGSGSMAALDDGATRFLLPELIEIRGANPEFRGESRAIDFGGLLTLHCLETAVAAGALTGILHWETRERPSLDFHHFVHGLDAAGDIIAQNDGEPLEGRYPTSHWRAGQPVVSRFSLEIDDEVAQVAFGLYDPRDGKRLPVALDGTITDRLLLTPEDASC